MLNSLPQGHLSASQQGRSPAPNRGLEVLALPQPASPLSKDQDHTPPFPYHPPHPRSLRLGEGIRPFPLQSHSPQWAKPGVELSAHPTLQSSKGSGREKGRPTPSASLGPFPFLHPGSGRYRETPPPRSTRRCLGPASSNPGLSVVPRNGPGSGRGSRSGKRGRGLGAWERPLPALRVWGRPPPAPQAPAVGD